MRAIMETKRRSIYKALSWRLLATVITSAVALVVTGEIAIAAMIGVVDTAIKLGVYYMHERVWNRLSFGRDKAPEYQI